MPKTAPESAVDATNIIRILEKRFADHMDRHPGLSWDRVVRKIDDKNIHALIEMERSGGEPDVIGYEKETDRFVFCDCSPETPAGRRSLCYDDEALESRKNAKPAGSTVGMCEKMKIELIDERTYRNLQELGDFDTKTSSWLLTPDDIRKKGGAIYGDKRYGHVFIYHNGAESYYASRGFRGILKV